MAEEFKGWAIVEVMGHQTYAGFVSVETIAGAAMLRVDVPQVANIPAFTKYVSPGALYGLTPVSEETARAKAEKSRSKPFDVWGIEAVLIDELRAKGKLIEHQPTPDERGEDEEYPDEE